MRNIITAKEVVELAFAENSNMREDSISNTTIHIAEIKYIRPVFGAMYALLTDKYADFTNDYVKPALAYFVKCEIVSSIAIDMSNSGVAVANPQYQSAATDKQRQRLYDSEMSKAKTLLDYALEYIATHKDEFPDFSGNAPKKHHRIGGLLLGENTSPKSPSSISGELLKAELVRIEKRVERLETEDDTENDVAVLFATTHSELKTKRDAGQLVAGAFYRIIDYKCTTTQDKTRSANHPFDIIVQALDECTLSENASAIQHEGDTYFADARLEAWRLKYAIDNDVTRFAWAQEEIIESLAKWSCAWGILEQKNSTDASNNYESATIDGSTRYLYRPATPTSHLNGKQFYRDVVVGSITSTEGFVYEADTPITYNEEEDYYEDYPSEIRVKSADGKLVATFINEYDNTYYDENDYNDMMEYSISFVANEYTEVDGVYQLTPSEGIEDWWESYIGGSIDTTEREYYGGSVDSLYYAFNSVLGKYTTSVYMVTDKAHIYYYEGGTLDTITYSAYVAPQEAGKGVIYRMIDEHNNDCPFDFKNMQFYPLTDEWHYAFSIWANGESADASLGTLCADNYLMAVENRDTQNVAFTTTMPVFVFKCVPRSTTSTTTNGTYQGIANNKIEVPISRGWMQAYKIKSNYLVASAAGKEQSYATFFITSSGQIYDNRIQGAGKNFIVNNVASPISNFFGNDIRLYPINSPVVTINCTTFAGNTCNFKIGVRGTWTLSGGSIQNCYIEDMGNDSSTTNTLDLNASLALDNCTLRFWDSLTLAYANTTSTSSPLRFVNIDARGWSGATTVTIPSTFPAKATYELKVAKNSAGTIKMWCEADKA